MPQSLHTPMLFDGWLIDWVRGYAHAPMLFDGWLIDWLIEYEDMSQSLRIPLLLQSLRTLNIDTSR